ncbi:F1/F0 ATPase, subunit 2 [Alkalibacterium subtropicum]|uniref:F1/F0 ATPase, subunit 2 n=1 Tax=Alkalibacterium subtropicum TaxID=753702 RepID=A0A1I1HLP9_9LACT|nr:ATP synthase subunit I [Alkalibacterium subtropicum]SFC24756.1 F1/F0 ATPase, subunit 2 [Alkalibacterium subtropicum]
MTEFFIGIILGITFFGGLYWTVEKLTEVKRPALLMTVSLILRMTVLLSVLFYVSKSGYMGIIYTLLGMLFVRLIMIFKVEKTIEKEERGDTE